MYEHIMHAYTHTRVYTRRLLIATINRDLVLAVPSFQALELAWIVFVVVTCAWAGEM